MFQGCSNSFDPLSRSPLRGCGAKEGYDEAINEVMPKKLGLETLISQYELEYYYRQEQKTLRCTEIVCES